MHFKNLTISLCILMCFGQALYAQTTISQEVNFEVDKYSLFTEAKEELKSFAGQVLAANEYELEIIGHTDQAGSEDYNIKLSEQRANTVSKFLIDLGIPTQKITLDFKGETDLLFRTNDEHAKSKNRRVNIVAYIYNYESTKDLVELITDSDEERKTINHAKPNVINLSQGTQVNIPKDAFCHLDGTPLSSNQVEVTFKEAYEFIDMIDQNLFTQTSDQILETAGMVYVSAAQNGKKLKLQDGKEISFLLREQEEKDGMEMFTGNDDGNGIIWEATNEPVSSKKEELFLQVDLSPILDYQYVEKESDHGKFAAMPKYPYAKRKANPPARSIYAEKKYNEVYKKYEEVMEEYNAFEKIRPQKVKEWKEEYERRKEILLSSHLNYIKNKISKRIQYAMKNVEIRKDTVSHHVLLNIFSEQVNRKIGKIPYSEHQHLVAVFGKNYGEMLRETNFKFPVFEERFISSLLPEILDSIDQVEDNITEKKFEMGIVDKRALSRYVMSSSELGWINCDRFIELEEEDRTSLMFASAGEDFQYYLIFDDIKSLIRPEKRDGMIVFEGMPKGKKVRIVGIGFSGKQAQLATKQLTLYDRGTISLEFKNATVNQIKKAVS